MGFHVWTSSNASECFADRQHRNYKPSESDLEDDDDEDEDDDPASWFEDDQDDGRKGQDIIEPDFEDYSDIIDDDDKLQEKVADFKVSVSPFRACVHCSSRSTS